MSGFVLRKHQEAGLEYKHQYSFMARMNDLTAWLSPDMAVQVEYDSLPKEVKSMIGPRDRVWYVVDGDDRLKAAMVFSNIRPTTDDPSEWWFWIVASDQEFGKWLAERLGENVSEGITTWEDEESGEEDDDEGMPWEIGDIVELENEMLARIKDYAAKGGYHVVQTDGKELVVQESEIAGSSDTSAAYDEIVRSFDLYGDRLEGDMDGEYNIVEFRGKLVRVLDVDGEDFQLNVDEEWLDIGERLTPSMFSFNGVFQQRDLVVVDVGGTKARGEIQGLDHEGRYLVQFEEYVSVPRDGVRGVS